MNSPLFTPSSPTSKTTDVPFYANSDSLAGCQYLLYELGRFFACCIMVLRSEMTITMDGQPWDNSSSYRFESPDVCSFHMPESYNMFHTDSKRMRSHLVKPCSQTPPPQHDISNIAEESLSVCPWRPSQPCNQVLIVNHRAEVIPSQCLNELPRYSPTNSLRESPSTVISQSISATCLVHHTVFVADDLNGTDLWKPQQSGTVKPVCCSSSSL
mmetsp:Transcript_18669/g.25749  ORF Transcript_18669/g.25749 Transcript_18669/m.25749 type:complete len:213 (-) Transcript_18669:232-870(-)